MSGLLTALGLLAVIVFVLFCASILSDAKSIRLETKELASAWSDYYEESQKFHPIKEFEVSYKNGETKIIPGRSISEGDDNFNINNEHDKVVAIVMKTDITTIKTNRQSYYVKGER